MKSNLLFVIGLAVLTTACTLGNSDSVIDRNLSKLSLVKENHLVMEKNGEAYVLDTYIQLFARPYYIDLKTKSGLAIGKKQAIDVSKEYIKPRGCTRPIENEKVLKVNKTKSRYIISLEC